MVDKPENSKKSVFEKAIKPEIAELREGCSHLYNYLTRMNEEGLVVYCRFGKDYLANLMKQAQSVSNNPSLAAPTKQIATYLINVKKLIRDHNIESESKDFTRLNTIKGNIVKKREPRHGNPRQSSTIFLPAHLIRHWCSKVDLEI